MTEFELFQALRPRYPAQEYALLPQVANATGANSRRHCDALALSLWPSRGLHLSGFEMKSHRGDWLRELRDPAKAEDIAQFCNYWWIVAAEDKIVQDGELPEGWGLLVWNPKRERLVNKTAAKFRAALKTPDIAFIAGVMRKAQDVAAPDGVIAAARDEGFKDGFEKGLARNKNDSDDLAKLREQLRDFEKASGVKIDSWIDGQQIGEAVNIVLNGTETRRRENLISTAKRILEDLAPLQSANGQNPLTSETGERSTNT
jgi:hypothetical protein